MYGFISTVTDLAELPQEDFVNRCHQPVSLLKINLSMGFTAERRKLSVSELLNTGPSK